MRSETLTQIILDAQEALLESGVPRRLKYEFVPGKASVFMGVRRCGKSTLVVQQIVRLMARGVDRQNILWINFFDDRLHGIGPHNIGQITDAYFSLYPEKKGTETVYCFFDEIQMADGWEAFVDRLLRSEKCEVVITGSSARMLSHEIATQMRGRALSWEVFPFSFLEFLDSRSISVGAALSTKQKFRVQKAWDEYWETGGFPEVAAQPILDGTEFVALSSQLRTRIHQEYFQSILYRDLVERYDLSHPTGVRDLAYRLLDNVASMYSVNSLTGYLKSLGHNIPKATVTNLMRWFEDAYLLFSVRIFDASIARINTNPKKVYCVDHALVRSISSGILVNSRHLLENLVFIALRRRYPEIYYYRTRGGKEVDFVLPQRGEPPMLVQVAESIADPKTRDRELTALNEAMGELGVTTAWLVTRNSREEVADSGTITVLSAWEFELVLEAAFQARSQVSP